MKIKNKIIASILIFSILVHSVFAPVGFVMAQEATPEPTPVIIEVIASPEPSSSPEPSASASPSPEPSLEPIIIEASPSPSPSASACPSPSPSPSEAFITNDNCAVIDNTSTTTGTSGENTVSSNDGTADLTTGNADANGNLQTNANTNVVSTSDPAVANNNTVTLDNEMSVEGTSGNNTLTENDGDVTLTTGDVELIANMLNILNLNVTGDDFLHLIINIFGQLNGNLDLDDIAHALGYENNDALKVIAQTDDSTDAEMSVDNTNNAVVNNELNVTGTTGGNQVSGNDGTANVVTGRIEIMANLLNFINSNFSGDKWRFIMVNIFGSLNGDIVVPETDNFTEGNTSLPEQAGIDQISVNNTNNVNLTNNVNAQGISGNNQQNNNDGDGHVTTAGQTSVETNILNFLNMNITGNNWVFLIVNVFGKWMGQIVGFGGSAPIDAPENGTFAALSTGGSTSGEQINQTTAVNNNNNATVNNNVNVSGVSGENQVNSNDGTTKIETGWVEINANLLNIINTNITGKSWMVVFLNVFGDFMGNLFFGKENIPVVEEEIHETEEDFAVGGPAPQTQQSNNQNTNAPIVAEQAVAPKPKKPAVLALNIEDDFSEESYQAVYEEEEPLSDNHEYEKLGFLALVLQFVTNIITKIKVVVEPVFAYVINLLPLS